LFNRAKHLFDSPKDRAGLTVAPDEKGPGGGVHQCKFNFLEVRLG